MPTRDDSGDHPGHALRLQARDGPGLRSRRAGRLRDGDHALRRLITIPISHYCEKARWALDRAAPDTARSATSRASTSSRRGAPAAGDAPGARHARTACSPSRRRSSATPTCTCAPDDRLFTGDPRGRGALPPVRRGARPRRPPPDLRPHARRSRRDAAVQQPGRARLGGPGPHAMFTVAARWARRELGITDPDDDRRRAGDEASTRRRAARRRPPPPVRRPLHRRRPDLRASPPPWSSRRSTASPCRSPNSSRRRRARTSSPSAHTPPGLTPWSSSPATAGNRPRAS